MKKLLASRDAQLEVPWLIVSVNLDFVEPHKNRMMHQKTSFQKTKASLEMRPAEAEAEPDAALTEMTTHRDGLHDEVDC